MGTDRLPPETPSAPSDPSTPAPAGRKPASPHGGKGERGRTWALWLISALLASAAFAYVVRFGGNVPTWDDWDMVPTITGAQPVSMEWLWSQHNEHRLPLPRLITVALFRVWPDFRAGMLLNVALLSLGAALVLRALRCIRGTLRLTDLFVPLAILTLGQAPNLLWSFQIQFVSSTVLMLAVLAMILTTPELERRHSAFVAAALCLLVSTGANGVIVVPGIVVWLLGLVLIRPTPSDVPNARRTSEKKAAVIAAGIGMAALVVYFIGYEPVPYHPKSGSFTTILLTTWKAAAMSFGAAAKDLWPFSGLVVAALLGASVVRLASVMRSVPSERVRAWGQLCFLGTLCALAAALGLGREGFEPRYVTLFTPLLCAIYATWVLYPPARYATSLRWALFAFVAVAFWPNVRYAVWYGRDLRTRLGWFEADLRSGIPCSELIARHHRVLHPQQRLLHDYLSLLRSAGFGIFRELKVDPEFDAMRIAPEAFTLTGATRVGATFTHDGSAHLVIQLPRPTRVAGVQLRFRFTSPQSFVPYVIVQWRRPEQPFNWNELYALTPTGDRANWERGTYLRQKEVDPTLQFWIYQDVEALDIRPDFWPGTFTIEDCTLLLPK